MSEKLKVLMGMDAYFPNVDGVVNCVHNYSLNMYKDVDLTLIVPKTDGKKKFPYKTLAYRSFKIPIMKTYYGFPNCDKKFKKAVLSKQYDIVYVHSPFAIASFALKVAKKQNIPAVATFHSNMRPIFKSIVKFNWLTESIIKKIGKKYNKFNEVMVCSPLVKKQLNSFGYTGKVSYLPFGTELEKCNNVSEVKKAFNEAYDIKDDEFVFVHVGRVQYLKRIDMILDSLKILKDKNIKFKFFIVGKGMDSNRLMKHAKKLGFNDSEVYFTGYIARELFPAMYARADLLLFPSLYDNFGLVKVEAASYETPGLFIQDSCAGYGVVDGHNGFLSKDTVADYADKIVEAITDRDKLEQVGKTAKEELYMHWSDCTLQMINKLDEIVKEWKNGNKDKSTS